MAHLQWQFSQSAGGRPRHHPHLRRRDCEEGRKRFIVALGMNEQQATKACFQIRWEGLHALTVVGQRPWSRPEAGARKRADPRQKFSALRTAARLIALFALAFSARAEIEFSGVLTMSGKTLFALTDTETARTDWVPLHGRFAKYDVSNYDQASETLTLTRPD